MSPIAKAKIYFRVKGGGNYGLGHVVRSVNLANGIRSDCSFQSKIKFFINDNEDVSNYITKHKFETIKVDFSEDCEKVF